MSVWVDNIYKVVTIVIVNQISIAFCNVIGEALVVETSQKQRLLDPDASAKNVSMYFMVKSIGSLLTAFSSGALLEVMDKRNVFLITACFPFMMVLSSILLIEKRLGDKPEDNGEEDPEVSQILNLSTTTKNLNDNYDTINEQQNKIELAENSKGE
jgi:Na+/melibiose symporter-like transporter